MFGRNACLLATAAAAAACIAPAACFSSAATGGLHFRTASSHHHRASSSPAAGRRSPLVVVASAAAYHRVGEIMGSDDTTEREGGNDLAVVRRGRSIGRRIGVRHRHFRANVSAVRRAFAASLVLLLGVVVAVGILPSPCLADSSVATMTIASGGGGGMPRPVDARAALISIVDGLSRSGTWGMAMYAFGFTCWTMTVGVTTPIETAAGMAFPLRVAMVLSAIGKVGGAVLQYALAKYLFSDYARKRMDGNEWMDRIDASFRSNPYKVALIWRFSPLPEFVKNVGPALVPGLKTRYQVLAILTHGLPFTALWSCMGNEAAIVARGVSPVFVIRCPLEASRDDS
jgi:uncharacterized membrane protein YdjX (TVP38/TMEM64 family)